jgi:CII-binding regulator of phage lambda lysogenization HflD
MSDVKVKFGAEDVGLEKTLNSIQAELGTLKSKISAGDLSMTELEKTMKRVGQVESLEKRLKGMASEASQTSPKMEELGKDMQRMADKAKDAGDKGSLSFGKLAAASAVGGLAVQAGMKVMELAMDAARAVVDKFGEAMDLGGRLSDLSKRTGETAGNVLVLERAFTNAGSSAENVGPAINKLQKFMEAAKDSSSEQSKEMTKLGISMADLEGKTPTQQMQVFADKISGIEDPTTRSATAMKVFGKSGGELLPILSDFSGELATAKGQLGSLPGIMDNSAKAFDNVSDNLTVMKGKVLDFAAGLLSKAAPALETFTNMLAGVDAAGWGDKTMGMIIRIADVFLGVFKSPMPAIEALGLALYAHIAKMGNLYINSLINGGNFLREFWSSELPSLLISRLSSSMMKGFADGLKFFVDRIGEVITGFREYFGKAVEAIGVFFASTFQKIVGFFANDFKNAMLNPIDFIRGKLESSLAGATKNNALTFKDEYNNASGSVIDRISKGLGAVSDTYGRDLDQSTGKIGQEWDKITGNLKTSSKDFFGAEPATNRLTDKLKEVEDSGRKFREELTKGTGEAGGDTGAIKNNLEVGANAMEKAAKEIKSVVLLSQTLAGDLEKFQKEDGIDPGGKLKKKFEEQKEAGQNKGAEATLRKIENNEREQELRGFGNGKDRRSVKDIAREEGVETFMKSNEEIRQEIIDKRNAKKQQNAEDAGGKDADAKRRQEELKPGKQGEKDKEPAKQESALSGVLGEIKGLVNSINGKLPLHALGY